VNKVSSKIVLQFDLKNSFGLKDWEKELLSNKLSSRLSKEGILQLSSSFSKSQIRNKNNVQERFLVLITEMLKRPIKRKPSSPTQSAIRRRANNKKKNSEKKVLRRKPKLD
jgi:ribosome-associated protein